ncbi:MAG: pitrilysin family protein [Bacteroidetes bacterium]|nr:pitrilysin family protein [Bacteroidota bacterium]
MINYKDKTLANGLKVIVHRDTSTPMAALNILYKVGARDEDPKMTGFAHLFEHLMFGGTPAVPEFDVVVQNMGGESNAFTTNDYTNYYITFPKDNMEVAFWLEADRMKGLAFTQKSLDTQKSVVIEEFKQRYLNQPYGDAWLKLRPVVYKVHPYRWATIGEKIEHIEMAQLQDVKDFFYRYYLPNNAVLVFTGDVEEEAVFAMADKYFGGIPSAEIKRSNYEQEPVQNEFREIDSEIKVPVKSFYQVYPMKDRKHDDFYATDLLSDVLARGMSSRLYIKLVKENPLFSELSAYVTGSFDPGLFIIHAMLSDDVDMDHAKAELQKEMDKILESGITENELLKVVHKSETSLVYSEMNVLNKAMSLAFFEMLEDASLVNEQQNKFTKVTAADVLRVAKEIIRKENCTCLNYKNV